MNKPRSDGAGKLTLAIDIGGSHLKTGVLNAGGEMTSAPARVATPQPANPTDVLDALVGLAKPLGRFDRISIGFPGVVRDDRVLTAPNLGTKAWHGFRLAHELAERLGKPARMLNDASIQGLGVIEGRGLECVLTLGTGMGFALFHNGRLAPHLEMGQHPIKTDKTYDRYVGDAAFQDVGHQRWNKRMQRVIATIATLTNYDVLYIGGGNAKHLKPPLPPPVKVVSNEAGITGGVRLWDRRMDETFAEQPAFD